HIPGAKLGIRRVDNELTIHAAHSYSTHRTAERNVRKRQRAARGVNADNVRIVFLVRGHHQRDHLRLITKAFREKGPDGTINLTAGKNFPFAGAAFTL